jgi:alkaline phosphatase D
MRALSLFLSGLLLFVLSTITEAQKPKLLAGPLIGATTANSTRVWFAYQGKSDNMVALFDSVSKEVKFPIYFNYLSNKKGQVALTVDFKNLRPNTTYHLMVKIGNNAPSDQAVIHTLSEEPVKDFSFLLGSCFLIGPGKFGAALMPGAHKRILEPMIADKADFNIWMGDNTYYIMGEWKSLQRMFKRQLNTRSQNPLYNKYLGSRPNYSIWDDHDYGPNNSDSSFALRDSALKVYVNFWPNPSYGKEGVPGIFYNLPMYDAEFFMTDDRSYRSPDEDIKGHMFGAVQMNWLKINLLLSDATFKFIVLGSQGLNECTDKECWVKEFPDEQKELMDFIAKNKIKGVIFLSGDRHCSHLLKVPRIGTYPLYEFMCSPVLTLPSKMNELELQNRLEVKGTLVQKQRNYGKISVSGEKGNRSCLLQDFDEYGKLLWEYKISENELK